MSGLAELLRSLPEIKAPATLVVGVVAVIAWVAAIYIRRRRPTDEVVAILAQVDEKDRADVVKELLGRDSGLPQNPTDEQILLNLRLRHAFRSKVLLLIAFTISALMAVMIAAMLTQRTEKSPTVTTTVSDTASTGPVVTTTTAATSTPATTTATQTTTQTAASGPPQPPRRTIDDIAKDVHGDIAADKPSQKTLNALVEISARKSEVTATIQNQLLNEATRGEQQIQSLLSGVGAPPSDEAATLHDLIKIHRAIAALAGETPTWPSIVRLFWRKREVIAEEEHLPKERP